MNYKTKKKIIHFYTSGAIAEDFTASRKRKLAFYRKVIRTCFYIQCVICAICAALGFLVNSKEAIPTAVCSGILLIAAFFAVGGTTAVKILSCILNFIFSAAGITVCILERISIYGVCGGIMLVGFIASCVSLRFSLFRNYLASYPARLIKREDYTLMRHFSDIPQYEAPVIENFTSTEEELPKLPQLTSEMRELANKLSDILNSAQSR